MGHTGTDMSKAETRFTLDNQKFLSLCMVVVATSSNTGVCGKVRELTRIVCFQHFDEDAARILMLFQGISKLFRRKVRNKGRIQCARQTGTNRFGDPRYSATFECVQTLHQIANGDVIDPPYFLITYTRRTLIHNIEKISNDVN